MFTHYLQQVKGRFSGKTWEEKVLSGGTIIIGGEGSGKTFTVLRLLKRFFSQKGNAALILERREEIKRLEKICTEFNKRIKHVPLGHVSSLPLESLLNEARKILVTPGNPGLLFFSFTPFDSNLIANFNRFTEFWNHFLAGYFLAEKCSSTMTSRRLFFGIPLLTSLPEVRNVIDLQLQAASSICTVLTVSSMKELLEDNAFPCVAKFRNLLLFGRWP
jgi:hypothetical protein